jgi:chromosome partitioning protein
VIPTDTQFREASELGRPLPQTAPGSRGAVAFLELVDALLTTDEDEQRTTGDVA